MIHEIKAQSLHSSAVKGTAWYAVIWQSVLTFKQIVCIFVMIAQYC